MPKQHEPNQPITLANTSIVEVDGQSEDVPVEVVFQLLPSPTIVIKADALPNTVLIKERFQIRLDNGVQLEAMVRSFNIGTSQGSLVPVRQPVDVIDKSLPIGKVNFGILNFPEVYGNQSLWVSDGQGSTAIPHARLDVSDWCVEITGVSNISDVAKTLRQDRGYGLTYTGVITHRGGADFSVDEAKALLESLRVFLSFTRGGYCSLALITGKDKYGSNSWVRWGSHQVSDLDNGHSWSMTVGGDDILSGLFPKFWSLIELKNGWRDTIIRTIDWYLRSNESPPYVGIILTQAALERLSSAVLDGKRYGSKTVEKALKKLPGMESCLPIPDSCEELRRLGNGRTGPHVLADIRNDLVHPKESLEGVSDLVHHEAWSLGQWYIEMMLLNKLGYQGDFKNRLARWHQRNQAILSVPWVSRGQEL